MEYHRAALREITRLTLLIATWSLAAGDGDLADRCVNRAAEYLGAAGGVGDERH